MVRAARVQSDAQRMREYDLIADWYASDRGRTVGVAEALAVAATLPAWSRILDVGCGNGVPITEALVNAGHRTPFRANPSVGCQHGRREFPVMIAPPVCVGSLHSTPVATQPLDSGAQRAISVAPRQTSIPTSNRTAERPPSLRDRASPQTTGW